MNTTWSPPNLTKAVPSLRHLPLLKRQRHKQIEQRLKAGELWAGADLVFTDELGRHLMHHTIYHNFKRVVSSIGCPSARFHDLRHSYAVAKSPLS